MSGTSTRSMLEVRGLFVTRGGRTVLRGVDCGVCAGERLSLFTTPPRAFCTSI